MPPRSRDVKDGHHHESTPLTNNHMSFGDEEDPEAHHGYSHASQKRNPLSLIFMGASVLFLGLYLREKHANATASGGPKSLQKTTVVDNGLHEKNNTPDDGMRAVGPYQLLECHEGDQFFDYYDFYKGADSEGSAGYNTYVSDEHAFKTGIANITQESSFEETSQQTEQVPFVYMSSQPTQQGPREAVRLEGRTLFNRGLFILDVRHMPAGCGVWPAFWLTNEEHWPDYGEVDIVEGINNQTQAKTALHTSAMCNMYAHVPDYNRTGVWDRASTYILTVFCGAFFVLCPTKAHPCLAYPSAAYHYSWNSRYLHWKYGFRNQPSRRRLLEHGTPSMGKSRLRSSQSRQCHHWRSPQRSRGRYLCFGMGSRTSLYPKLGFPTQSKDSFQSGRCH